MPINIGTSRALLASRPTIVTVTPVIVSLASATNSLTGGHTTVTAPTSITSGNLLLAIAASGTETWTPPSGWTLFGTKASSGDDPQISVFTKTATGSESGTYVWSGSGDAADATNVAIFNISGANTTTPINGMFSKYTTTAAVTIGTSGTSIPTVIGCLPIACGAIGQLNLSNAGNPTSLTSGWTGQTLVVDQDTGNYGNTGNNNGYNALYIASGPITTDTSTAITAGWTWGGSFSEFTGTSVMLFIT